MNDKLVAIESKDVSVPLSKEQKQELIRKENNEILNKVYALSLELRCPSDEMLHYDGKQHNGKVFKLTDEQKSLIAKADMIQRSITRKDRNDAINNGAAYRYKAIEVPDGMNLADISHNRRKQFFKEFLARQTRIDNANTTSGIQSQISIVPNTNVI